MHLPGDKNMCFNALQYLAIYLVIYSLVSASKTYLKNSKEDLT